MPDKVKSFGEVNSSENCLRAQLEFDKPMKNGLRKKQNFIKSRLSRAKTGLAGIENGVSLQKEE